MLKILLKFSTGWVYGGDGTNSFIIFDAIAALSKKFKDSADVGYVEFEGISVISHKGCERSDERRIIEEFRDTLNEIIPDIKNTGPELDIETESGKFHVGASFFDVESEYDDEDYDAEEYDDEYRCGPPVQPSNPASRRKRKNDRELPALNKITNLVGMKNFRDYCIELERNIDFYCRKPEIFYDEALLFVSDDGNGYEECLSLFYDYLREKDLIGPEKMYFTKLGSYADKPENFPHVSIFCNKNVNIYDIDGWTGHTNAPKMKETLRYIADEKENSVVIFRIGNHGKTATEETISDISDVMNVRKIEFPTLSTDELYHYALEELGKLGIRAGKRTKEIFIGLCKHEKEDGLFYGIKTAKKVAMEMARASVETGSKREINDVVCELLLPDKQIETDGMKALDELIGIDKVKTEILEITSRIRYSRRTGKEMPSMHMLFTGSPGTGKTTVARILGEIFREEGLLRIGKFYEYKGRDLCEDFIGGTAKKVTDICRTAYGSVLFIDEAYSLASERGGRDYGKEAIDTLIAEMENHRDDLVVIFAGYTDEMEMLFNTNPGLRSRIPFRIEFPDYSRENLFAIFEKMVSKNDFACDKNFISHAETYFMSLPDSLLESDQFGNARFVRNIFDRTCGKAILRNETEGADVPVLTAADFDAASAECDTYAEEKKEKTNKIGF